MLEVDIVFEQQEFEKAVRKQVEGIASEGHIKSILAKKNGKYVERATQALFNGWIMCKEWNEQLSCMD